MKNQERYLLLRLDEVQSYQILNAYLRHRFGRFSGNGGGDAPVASFSERDLRAPATLAAAQHGDGCRTHPRSADQLTVRLNLSAQVGGGNAPPSRSSRTSASSSASGGPETSTSSSSSAAGALADIAMPMFRPAAPEAGSERGT